MFERYDINDLFLLEISASYPFTGWETDAGGLLMTCMSGYGYWTIAHKVGEKYVDLQNRGRVYGKEVFVDRQGTSYTINRKEPLSKYYNQDGTKKPRTIFSKRGAIKAAQDGCIDAAHKDYLKELDEQEKKRKGGI